MDRPRRPAAALPAIPARAPLRPPVRARRVRRRVRRRDGPGPAPVHARRAAGARGAGVAHPPGRDRRRRQDGRRRGARHPAHPRRCWRSWRRRRRAARRADVARLAVGAVFLPADPAAGAAARRILDDALAAEGPAGPRLAARAGRSVRPRARGGRVRARHSPRRRRPPGRDGPGRLRPRPPPRPADGRSGRGDGRRARGPSTSRRSRGGRSSTRASSSAASSAASTATSPTGAVRGPVRRVPPALLHQHASLVGARPAVPADRPQRRDQHRPGQPRGDARAAPRGSGGGALGRRLGALARRGAAAPRPGRVRLHLARRGRSSCSSRPAGRSTRRSWRSCPRPWTSATRPCPASRPGRRRPLARVEPWDGPAALVFSRWPARRLRAGPQRPAAGRVRGPPRRPRRVRLGGRDAPGRRPRGRPARAPWPGRAARGRHGGAVGCWRTERRSGRRSPAAPAGLRSRGCWNRPRVDTLVGRGRARTPTSARRRQILFGLDAEQLRMSVKAMATGGREPTWSMGDDTPLAVLARRPARRRGLPPPGVRPGDEPADRSRARARGHVPGRARRPPAAAPRPGRPTARRAACGSRPRAGNGEPRCPPRPRRPRAGRHRALADRDARRDLADRRRRDGPTAGAPTDAWRRPWTGSSARRRAPASAAPTSSS